jgi:hypothetical protein
MAASATKHRFFQPDGQLLVSLVARLFTRNTASPVQRSADRLQMQKNISNLAFSPDLHLGYCVQLMERYATEGAVPTFEIGLVMGAALAMCSCSRKHELLLKKMLADIEKQQDSNLEEVGGPELDDERFLNPEEKTDEELGSGTGQIARVGDGREDEGGRDPGADQGRTDQLVPPRP